MVRLNYVCIYLLFPQILQLYALFFCLTHVTAKPVFLDKSSLFQDKFLIFQIRIYSNPEPNAFQWFHNNQVIDDQRIVNTSLRETMVEITLHDTKVNATGYMVFLKTRFMPENSTTVYKCQIRNTEGAINVLFDETRTHAFDGNIYTLSTMGNSSARYETSKSKYIFLDMFSA